MLLAGVLACMLLAGNSGADKLQQGQEGPSNLEKTELREKLIFYRTSTTVTFNVISTFTTVIPLTCYKSNTNACQGRKLRRMKSTSGDFDKLLNKATLDSSVTEELTPEKETVDLGDNPKFLTVWKSTTTTYTVTTTSYNRGLTVSASAYCTYTGFSGPIC
ncbi:uncharacterized protein LOC125044587 [Penaeus chinensis]|uniref:uncharacterized protein LOC125044587 n=1 Tax=Penaeus chinensis TaxID=139456 RepID=UPI001FB7D920|nr:uncharacterized protein LOC125044587 [Penaeus chinensis]